MVLYATYLLLQEWIAVNCGHMPRSMPKKEIEMRFAIFLAGTIAMLTLASCQSAAPISPKDRSANDTGMYGGHKGNFHTK